MEKTSISKIKQTSGFTDSTTKKEEYMDKLRNKNLDNVVDRHEFFTTTVSHLEHHLRKIIAIEILENKKHYENIWKILVIPANHKFPTNSSSLEDEIISYLSFNSTGPVLRQLENFSLIENFFEWFNPNPEDHKNILEIYETEQRNEVQHPGRIPSPSKRLREIKENIDGFFDTLMITYRASLSYGRTIKKYDSQTADTEIKETIKKQKIRLEQIQKLINRNTERKISKREFMEHYNNLKLLFGVHT